VCGFLLFVWNIILGTLREGREFAPTPFLQDQLLGSSMGSLMLLLVAQVLKEGFLTHLVVQTSAGMLFWPEDLHV